MFRRSLLRANYGWLSGSLPSAVDRTHPPRVDILGVPIAKAPLLLRLTADPLKSGYLTLQIGCLGVIAQKFTVSSMH